jgi:hypothetical protein
MDEKIGNMGNLLKAEPSLSGISNGSENGGME